MLRNLGVSKVFLWPRFHSLVSECLEGHPPEVEELVQGLTGPTKEVRLVLRSEGYPRFSTGERLLRVETVYAKASKCGSFHVLRRFIFSKPKFNFYILYFILCSFTTWQVKSLAGTFKSRLRMCAYDWL